MLGPDHAVRIDIQQYQYRPVYQKSQFDFLLATKIEMPTKSKFPSAAACIE